MGVVPGVWLTPMEPAVQKTIQQVVGNRSMNAERGSSEEPAEGAGATDGQPPAAAEPRASGGGQ
jgi:hypothetical protein